MIREYEIEAAVVAFDQALNHLDTIAKQEKGIKMKLCLWAVAKLRSQLNKLNEVG